MFGIGRYVIPFGINMPDRYRWRKLRRERLGIGPGEKASCSSAHRALQGLEYLLAPRAAPGPARDYGDHCRQTEERLGKVWDATGGHRELTGTNLEDDSSRTRTRVVSRR